MPDFTELETEATGPLKGIRIVDLTTVVNGAYATQLLADQGAEVIKVEDPTGDIIRTNGHIPAHAPQDLGPIFVNLNRNKRSIMLDLRQEKAKQAMSRLIASADVFVASVRYDGLKRLGLSYEEVSAIRPDIVYAHASGFGSDGPYAGEPAYDDLIQVVSGMADLLPRTYEGMDLAVLPTLIADKISGVFLSQAVTAALFHRLRTGEGQFIEVPMLETTTAFLMVENLFDHVYEPPTGPIGYPRVLNPFRKPFKTQDGYVSLLPYTDKHWAGFFSAAGFGESVMQDPRFATYNARNNNIRELYALVEQAAITKTSQQWLDILRPLSIPAARANRLDELEQDPHLAAVKLFQRYRHPAMGPYKQIRPPVKFSKTPSNVRRHPPSLGEQGDEILAELGLLE